MKQDVQVRELNKKQLRITIEVGELHQMFTTTVYKHEACPSKQ